MKFLKCPACGRRGVFWTPRKNNEDAYTCRYRRYGCEWWVFSSPGQFDTQEDRDNLAAFYAANGWDDAAA